MSARRVHETTHRRRLPLTDPRIHEWSVGYQWAARCYPHALDGALFFLLLLLLRHFLLPLPCACSRSHAIRSRSLRRAMTKATTRMHEITAGPRYFFPASSGSFFLSRESGSAVRKAKIARRVTTSPLRVRACVPPCVRTYMRYYTAPKGERERESVVLGKTFTGTCENRLDRALEYEIKLTVR